MNFINFFGLSYENDEFSGFKDEVDEGGRWMLPVLNKS